MTFHVFGLRETMHCLRAVVSPFSASPSSTGSEKDHKKQCVPLNEQRFDWKSEVSIRTNNTGPSYLYKAVYHCLGTFWRTHPVKQITPSRLLTVTRGRTRLNETDPSSHCSHPDEEGRVENVLYRPRKRLGVNDEFEVWNRRVCWDGNRDKQNYKKNNNYEIWHSRRVILNIRSSW